MNTSKRAFLLATSAVALSFTLARAGGIERICSGALEINEGLPGAFGSGPVTFTWRFCGGPLSTRNAPGYPGRNCYATQPTPSQPAIQSISRAVDTWNAAGISGVTGPVTRLAVANSPSAIFGAGSFNPICGCYGTQIGFNADGLNNITLWEDPGTFAFLGSAAALAVSPVYTNASGVIVEADIAFNALALDPLGSGQPLWSFVETNDLMASTFATTPNSLAAAIQPILGFADLQGVATHEIGHVLGLGHSLVDSSMGPSSSLTPTMFAIAQGQPFSDSITVPVTGCVDAGWTVISPPAGAIIVGRSAATLEQDDVSAVFAAYGATLPSTPSTPGRIVGTISGSAGGTVRGVHVVATNASAPDQLRVGTLSFAGGAYEITGLPPGNYFVQIERADTTGYFPDLPNYLVPAAGGCVSPPVLATEIFNTFDANNDGRPQTATSVPVVAGLPTTVNLVLETITTNPLTVRNLSGGAASSRGVRVTPAAGGPYPTVRFQVSGQAPGTGVWFLFDLSRTDTLVFGQLAQGLGATTLFAAADGSGNAIVDVPLSAAWGFSNLFCQAAIFNGVDFTFTNPTNMWVTNP